VWRGRHADDARLEAAEVENPVISPGRVGIVVASSMTP
jgi:hypothetical protein